MKTVTLFLAILVFSTATPAPAASRLALWVTDPIGATSGIQCVLAPSPAGLPELPAAQPTLTEQDVSAWNPDNACLTLDPARFAGRDTLQKLADHCFVLAIDGKLISSGVVLSSHSARLTGFPSIVVYNGDHELYLQLISSNRGSHTRPIHIEALNEVLLGR